MKYRPSVYLLFSDNLLGEFEFIAGIDYVAKAETKGQFSVFLIKSWTMAMAGLFFKQHTRNTIADTLYSPFN